MYSKIDVVKGGGFKIPKIYVDRHELSVDKNALQNLNGYKSKVFWFTGLSGAGKSTVANALAKELYNIGRRSYVLDGDNLRLGINADLGFSEQDRIENQRRVFHIARMMVDAGMITLVATISPFQEERDMARSHFQTDEFIEVFLDVPLEVCEARDPRGLYLKARAGDIENFTGIGSPYEKPKNPEVIVSDHEMPVDDIVQKLMLFID